MTETLARPMTPTEVRRAHQLLNQRETLSGEFRKMTAGGSLPTLKEIVLHSATKEPEAPGVSHHRWELVNLTNYCQLNREEIERRVCVAILTLLSDQIDEIDRQLRENGVQPPPAPVIPGKRKGGA